MPANGYGKLDPNPCEYVSIFRWFRRNAGTGQPQDRCRPRRRLVHASNQPYLSLNVTKGNPAPARQMQLQGFCMFSISLGRNGYQVSVENDLDFIISYSDYLDKQFGDCLFLLKRILPPTVNTVLDFFGI